jgi:hypothetical protein
MNWNAQRRPGARPHKNVRPQTTRAQQQRRPSKTEFRLARIQEISAKYEFYERLSVVGVWVRLALVGALTISLFWWPYGRSCGFGLGAFLASNVMAMIAGLTLSLRTWRDRAPLPFTGALLFAALAWTVIAVRTLPRLTYPVTSAAIATLYCPASR